MQPTKHTNSPYRILVYSAYGYFILMGASWLVVNYSNNGHINIYALLMIVIFLAQAWFRNTFANLIIGIIALFMSIWTLLELVAAYHLFDKKHIAFDTVGKIFLVFAVINIIMSGILIFSYLKFNTHPDD